MITYATLIVGELVPKQVALRDPEAVAVRVAPAMVLLAKISLPLVFLLDMSGKAILILLGQGGDAEEKVSEDEIHSLVQEAETAGVLEPGEKEMIAGVMRLGDRAVGAVMTPRPEVDVIDLNDAPEAIRETFADSPHSRLPVSDGNRDDPIGIIQAKDLLAAYMRGEKPDIRSLVREAPVIPSSADARDVLAILRTSPVHMGLVYDEYGAFEGVVTTADILEFDRRRVQFGARPRRAGLCPQGRRLLSGVRMDAGRRIRRSACGVDPRRPRLPYRRRPGAAALRRAAVGRRRVRLPGLAHRDRRSRRSPHRQAAGQQTGRGRGIDYCRSRISGSAVSGTRRHWALSSASKCQVSPPADSNSSSPRSSRHMVGAKLATTGSQRGLRKT